MSIRQLALKVLQKVAADMGGSVESFNDTDTLKLPVGEGMEIKLSYFRDEQPPNCCTNYTAKEKHFTFDRYGVDDSFYYDSLKELPGQIEEQIERVKKSQERLANMAEFNLGPRTKMFTREDLDKMVETLQSGQVYSVRPAGFGRGYTFCTNPRIRNRYDSAQASQELVLLVGKPVYVSTFDCD